MSEQKGAIEIVEPSRAERAVIRRSAESRATVPDLELEVEVDITEAVRGGVDLEAVILAAAARALTEHRRLNGAYRDGHYELHGRVNAGVVLGDEATYPVATVFDADRLEPAAITAELARLRGRAAGGELSPPELSGATFSFWFAGGAGVSRAVLPVIPPHAAALVAGAPRPVPRIHDGDLVRGELVTLTLTCDHRIAFGLHATGFLTSLKARLEGRAPGEPSAVTPPAGAPRGRGTAPPG